MKSSVLIPLKPTDEFSPGQLVKHRDCDVYAIYSAGRCVVLHSGVPSHTVGAWFSNVHNFEPLPIGTKITIEQE